MTTTPASSLPFPVELPAQPGMILRFVDAFPSAAAAVKPTRSTHSPRKKPRTSSAPRLGEAARPDVLVVRL